MTRTSSSTWCSSPTVHGIRRARSGLRPGYTNIIFAGPTNGSSTNIYLTNVWADAMTNGQYVKGPDGNNYGPWSVNLGNDTNLAVMPSMTYTNIYNIHQTLTNAIGLPNTNIGTPTFAPFQAFLSNQVFQSIDSGTNEPLYKPGGVAVLDGAPMTKTNSMLLYTDPATGKNYYTHDLDVWLQPGSVVYYYANGSAYPNTPSQVFVSDLTNPTKNVMLHMTNTAVAKLVVPGYVVDGIAYDGLDLGYSDPQDPKFPYYRCNNYQEAFMWPDDTFNSGGSLTTTTPRRL